MLVSATTRSAPIITAIRREGNTPSASAIAANTSVAPVTALTSTAANTASHSDGPSTCGTGASTCSVITARHAVRPNCARLNNSLSGECPRVNASTSAGPTTCASTSSCGEASSRPRISGSSEIDSECALPRTCAWTTNSSVAANPAASAHHGLCGPSA